MKFLKSDQFHKVGWVFAAALGAIFLGGGFQSSGDKFGVVDLPSASLHAKTKPRKVFVPQRVVRVVVRMLVRSNVRFGESHPVSLVLATV